MENPLLWGLDHLQEIKTWQCQIRQRNAGWLMCGVSTGRLSPVSPLGPQRDISFNWGADCTSPAALVSASQMHTAASHSSGKSSDKGLLTLHATGTGKRKKKFVLLKDNIFYEWKAEMREQNQAGSKAVLGVMAVLHTPCTETLNTDINVLCWHRDTSLNLQGKNISAQRASPFSLVVTYHSYLHFCHSLNPILYHTNVHVSSITDMNGINQH